MENKDIHFDDATIKDIRTKLNERNHSVSHDDIMENLMERIAVYEQKTSTDTTNSDEYETPEEQFAHYVNKQIVKKVEKNYNIQQYHKKYNIPYPMSEIKRKQHKLKKKKLKKLNRK